MVVFLTTLTLLLGCQSGADREVALSALEKQLTAQVVQALSYEVQGEVEKYVSMWHEDGEQVSAGKLPVVGKQAIGHDLKAFLQQVEIVPITPLVEWCTKAIVVENMGTVRCNGLMKLVERNQSKPASQSKPLSATLIYVLKKEQQQWLFVQEMTIVE